MKTKHSIIIGGTKGMGRVLVRALAQSKHRVSVIGRRPMSSTESSHINVHYFSTELSDWEILSQVLLEIVVKNGKIDNIFFFQRYRDDGDNWSGEIATSLTATKNIIELLSEKFKKNGDKTITIVSSLASRLIADEQPLSYHVAKAALEQMVRYYAVSLGGKQIRVNAVTPATVLKEESKDFYLNNKKILELYQKITPLGRMGTAEEIIHVILFLCSSDASFITGQNIIVDGGLSLHLQTSLAHKLIFDDITSK